MSSAIRTPLRQTSHKKLKSRWLVRNQRQEAETTTSEVRGEDERDRCVGTQVVSCHGLWRPGEATLAHQRNTAHCPLRAVTGKEKGRSFASKEDTGKEVWGPSTMGSAGLNVVSEAAFLGESQE